MTIFVLLLQTMPLSGQGDQVPQKVNYSAFSSGSHHTDISSPPNITDVHSHVVVGYAHEQHFLTTAASTDPYSYPDHSSKHLIHRCKLCNYSAIRKSDMTNHVRTHTKEKPFRCSLCAYRTNFKSDLMKHNRLKHAPLSTTLDSI